MKKILFLMICCGFALVSCAGTQTEPTAKKKLYTSCNIWVHPYMKCINYKMGEFIPAGAEVFDLKITSDDQGVGHILFKTVGDKKIYKMGFNRMWHPGKRIKDYKNYLFAEKPFDEVVDGMSAKEIDAIKQGKIVVGMSKKAVLVSYGRPAEHRTPDLESNQWRYWMNKRKQKTICFHNDLTIRCVDLKKLTDEL